MNKDKAKSAPKPSQEQHLLMVGIGASAGGIMALKRFFSVMPTD